MSTYNLVRDDVAETEDDLVNQPLGVFAEAMDEAMRCQENFNVHFEYMRAFQFTRDIYDTYRLMHRDGWRAITAGCNIRFTKIDPYVQCPEPNCAPCA